MVKGHLDQSRKNQGSTKTKPTVRIAPDPQDPGDLAIHLDQAPPQLPTATDVSCYAAIFEPIGQVYSDQTGKFVVASSRGNNYLLVLYNYDTNSIFAPPFKNRTAKYILAAYQAVHQRLCNAGHTPKLQRLDNERSTILKRFLTDNDIDYQLVPPGVHRRNAAECAIRTFQNHFIAGLCSVDTDFPLHLWDHLLPQAELTLNLMRGSRLNPTLSAWAQVHRNYDYNRTPLGPPGCRVLAHEKSAARTTWSPHALDGWRVVLGTRAQRWTRTDAIEFGFGKPVTFACATPSRGFPQRWRCPKVRRPT
jgi:hypothetical protein